MTTIDARIIKMSPQFSVTNLDNSILFYTEKLGFDLEFRYEDFYAGVIINGCSIHMKQGKPSTEERKRKRANDDLDILFAVEDVVHLYNQFQAVGIDIVQPLCDRLYGKEFYIANPDGYIFGYLQTNMAPAGQNESA